MILTWIILSQEYQLTYEVAKTEASQLEDASQVSHQVKEIAVRLTIWVRLTWHIDDYAALDERYITAGARNRSADCYGTITRNHG